MDDLERLSLFVRDVFGLVTPSEGAKYQTEITFSQVEDSAMKAGLMEKYRATEPCGSLCVCSEFEDLPCECVRFTEDGLRILGGGESVLPETPSDRLLGDIVDTCTTLNITLPRKVITSPSGGISYAPDRQPLLIEASEIIRRRKS